MTGFREQGSGIPLTLLHGISSGAASWHKQMALPGYRVLAWDMPLTSPSLRLDMPAISITKSFLINSFYA